MVTNPLSGGISLPVAQRQDENTPISLDKPADDAGLFMRIPANPNVVFNTHSFTSSETRCPQRSVAEPVGTLILGCALLNTAILLRKDEELFTRDTLAGLSYLFGFRGLVTRLLPPLLRYLSPRFHP